MMNSPNKSTSSSSMWPVVTSVGAAIMAIGLVTSAVVTIGGVLILLVGVVEWMVKSWSESASDDSSYNSSVRKRLLNPIEFPVLGAVGLGVVIFSFSRIMLAVDKAVGATLFVLLGALVLAVGTLFSVKSNVKQSVTVAICVAGAVGIVLLGVASSNSGLRKDLVEASEEHHFSHQQCGPERSEHFDKAASGTLSLQSSETATVVYQDGELFAEVEGIVGKQKSITISASNPTNIVFRNATAGDYRLVANLGLGTHDHGSHLAENVVCTQLAATGSQQGLTLLIAKPSSHENVYSLYIAGAEDDQIELVVP